MVAQQRSEDSHSPHQSSVYNMMTIAKKSKEEEEKEKTWAILPDDLLWKIKEQLNFVQNLYMAAVCKDWKWACSRCPRSITRSITTNRYRFSMPWFMDYRGDDKLGFIDPWLGKKKYTFKHPEIVGGRVVYSKEGWLLLLVESHEAYSPFLLGPQTLSEIEMPKLPYMEMIKGTFSVSDGVPIHIVLAGYDYDDDVVKFSDRPPSFFIINTSDQMCWRKYTPTFARPVRFMLGCGGFLVVGCLVYYFDNFKGMLVFDLATLEWGDYRRIKPLYDGLVDDHIMECDGEIVNVRMGSHHDDEMNGVRFFKLDLSSNNSNNNEELLWKELKDDDPLLQDRAWFIGIKPYAGFTRKIFHGKTIKKLVYYSYNLIFYAENSIFQDLSGWIIGKDHGLEELTVPVPVPDTPSWRFSNRLPSWVDIS